MSVYLTDMKEKFTLIPLPEDLCSTDPDYIKPMIYKELWEAAYEWACDKLCEELNAEIDFEHLDFDTEDHLYSLQEKHYYWLCDDIGIESYIYE